TFTGLMHINNKAMWIESFTVAAPVLRLKSGLTDGSFKRARTELKEKGYIDYESRGSGQAPAYRMVGLSQRMNHGADCGVSQDAVHGTGRNASECADQRADWNTGQDADRDVNRDTDWGANQR